MKATHRSLIMTERDHNRIITRCGAHLDLVDLLKSAADFKPANAGEIEAARDIHGCDEVEIDDNAGISEADDAGGYWVQVWVER